MIVNEAGLGKASLTGANCSQYPEHPGKSIERVAWTFNMALFVYAILKSIIATMRKTHGNQNKPHFWMVFILRGNIR